jgi:amino acid transporter
VGEVKMAKEEKSVWVRPATGLVRTFSTFDMWLMNAWVGVPILQPWYMFPLIAFYPGGNFLVGGTIALGLALIPAATYAFMAASMPRSGGDYVYWSRLIHPVVGFMVTFSLVFWINWWIGSNMWGTAMFFADFVRDLGLAGLADWIYTGAGTVITGTILQIILLAVLIFSMRSYRYVQAIFFSWGLLACLEMVVIVSALGPAFTTNLQNLYGVSASQIIAMAREAGFDATPILWQNFLPMIALMWYAMLSPWWSQYLSGEIKSAETLGVHVKAIVLGGLTTGIFVLLLYLGIYVGIGKDLYNAIVYLFYFAPDKYPFGQTAPWIWNLARMMTGNNPIVGVSLSIPLFLAEWVLNAMNFLIFSRIFFAWAWDRLIPAKMAYVHPKWHTPVVSLIVTFIIGEISFILQTFQQIIGIPWLTDVMAATIGALLITFATAMFCAAVVPYKNKEFYEASPMKKYEIAGIPLITILGLCGGILLLLMAYQYIVMELLNISWLLPLAILVFIVGIILYYIIKAIRRAQGIDITLAFKEIPAE